MLAAYSKSIVAFLAFVLVIVKEAAGFDLGVTAEQIWTFALPILTMIGVYAIPNK